MLCTITNRSLLAQRLAQLKKVLPSTEKNTVPILSNILLECSGSHVSATVTDLELAVRVRVPARVMQPGKVCLPGKLFADYLAILESEEVRVSSLPKAPRVVFESEWVSESGGTLVSDRTRLKAYDPEEYPHIPTGISFFHPVIQIESTPLKKALREVLPFVERDVKYQSLSIYTNIQLEVDAGFLSLTSGNGRIFARTRVSLQQGFRSEHNERRKDNYTMLVYGSTLKRITDFLPAEGETIQLLLAGDEKSLRFVIPSTQMTIICRTAVAQDTATTPPLTYPDVSRHFSTRERESVVTLERAALLKALKRMKLVTEKQKYGNHYDVRLTISHAVGTGLHLESVKTDIEVTTEPLHLKVPATLLGRPFDYYIVSKQLEDILSKMTDIGTVRIAVNHEEESFLIAPLVPSGLSYVIKEADVAKEEVRQEERRREDERLRAEAEKKREEERIAHAKWLEEHAEEIRLREEQERERRAELARQQIERSRQWEAEKARRRAEAATERARLREEKKAAEKAEQLRVREQKKEEKRRERERERTATGVK